VHKHAEVNDQVKEDEMERARSTHGSEGMRIEDFGRETSRTETNGKTQT
jgi:hypothetical protein